MLVWLLEVSELGMFVGRVQLQKKLTVSDMLES